MRKCACCANEVLSTVWDLPNLPLTGIYLSENTQPSFEYFHSQSLLFCDTCSHMQLSKIVDPDLLYLETYTHRTSTSPISKSGNEFLLKNIVEKEFIGKTQILEIGCNDVYLLKNLKNVAKHRAGMDPIFENKKIEIEPGIFVHGGFSETINYEDLIENPIDLIISAHTFEHIVDPIKSLLNLKPYLSEKVDFIIEVPSSPRMLDQIRLDQVFSQHINYYSPQSLSKLMETINLELISIEHNYSYWGGTQILHFSNYLDKKLTLTNDLTKTYFMESKKLFLNEMENVKFKIKNVPGKLFAYGAAQMLPILSYHLGESFDYIDGILDDNLDRVGMHFPYLDSLTIKSLDEHKFNSDDTFMITALDSAKPLIKRLIDKKVNLIILPIGNV